MLHLARSLVALTSRTLRRRSGDGFLLAAERLELAATAERMRVDRNGSVVSLLIIKPSPSQSSPEAIRRLEQMMAARLRLTDTAGWLRGGKIGVLLPDTPEAGAWKVAADLCELYDVGADRPDCEVLVYPDDDRRDDGPEQSNGSPSGDRHAESLEVATLGSRNGDLGVAKCSAFDQLFSRRLPLWKRLIDITGASAGLLLASPVIAASALAIRATTAGPAFFTQEREGLGGRRFKIYKLRTMRTDAEQLKSELRVYSEQDGPAFKMADDPRVTVIGSLLRKTSIDELPQLLNVLRGEMSLVGPRPLPVDESLACKPWQRRRLHVTPGLTCTWQVYGRNMVPFDEWIRMDLDYADRRNPWLDLELVAKTGPTLLLRKGQ